jgi:hypothetical protein
LHLRSQARKPQIFANSWEITPELSDHDLQASMLKA